MQTTDEVTGPINLGNPTETSIVDLAKMIIDLTGSRSHIVHRPARTDDPRQRQPNIARAGEALDWQPQTRSSKVFRERFLILSVCWRKLTSATLVEQRVM